MFVSKENWEDVKKYFEKTYVKFPALTGDTLWFIDRVTPEEMEVSSINKKEENIEYCIDLTTGYEMDFVFPKKTVYQYGDTAALLQRVPARQWKKGMCKANTGFSVLSENGWINGTFDAHIIDGFINKPSYYFPYDALKKFKQENSSLISAALTPRCSIDKRGVIWIDNVAVAKHQTLKATGETLSVKAMFYPYLSNIFFKHDVIKKL